MIFAQSHDDRKVRQFSLATSFLEDFEGKQPAWGPVGYFTYKRCVDVSTPVLCGDLKWRSAGSLRVGQDIIGFDADREGRRMRHIQHGVVTHNKVEMAHTMGIELEDGTTLYATPDHGWLVKLSESDNRLYWKDTQDLGGTHKGGSIHLIRPFGPMWDDDGTFDGGFLSAAFDGEGCLDRHSNLTFIQVGNPMLEKVEGILQQRRVPYKKYKRKFIQGRQQVYTLRITHRSNFYRVLGMLQPPRLMVKFQEYLKSHGGGAMRTRPEDYVRVVRVFDAGERAVAVLSTSVGTHFTGGYASHNTYAKTLAEGVTEEFFQTCQRVVEGVYNVQKIHCRRLGLPWSEPKAQRSAQEMYQRMWDFKFTPPGRGLAQMGNDFMFEKGGACLNNCGFISSENIDDDFADPFIFLMDMSMLGVGVGGDTRGAGKLFTDTKGAGKVKLQTPKVFDIPLVVPDTREGWVAMAKSCLNPFVGKGSFPGHIDFTLVRKAGEPIKGFGGTASGPGPLAKLAKNIVRILLPKGVIPRFEEVFNDVTGEITHLFTSFEGESEPRRIESSDITDVFNVIGACVVAGGVRRCIPKGTLVHTSEGLVPIEHVTVGSSVMTSQGYSKVTDWMNQGAQSISSVTTQMGVFEATDKHEIAVISDTNGGYDWKRLHELEPGDRMVFVDHPIEGVPTALPGFTYDAPAHSTTCKNITIPALTPDIAWLFGLIAGDGYVRLTDTSGEVSVAISWDQPHLKDKAVEILSLFSVNVAVQAPVEGDRCFKVRVKSKQLATYLWQFKQPKTPLVVPGFVLKGLPEIRAAYVAGLADADGSFKTRPMLVASSVYPDYLDQVQAVLASLGIPARKTLIRPAKGTWQPLFNLKVVGEKAVQQFTLKVAPFILKFEDERKTGRSGNDYGFPSDMALANGISGHKDGRMVWSRTSRQITVAKLEDITGRTVTLVPVEVLAVDFDVREDDTYDITVDAGEFVVQGGYLVHNSAEIMFGYPEDKAFLNLKDDSTLRPLTARMDRLLMVAGETPSVDQKVQIAALGAQIDAHPLRSHRWASNNSIFGTVGMDYTEIGKSIARNGEPGILWLKNAQDYGRMIEPPNFKDRRARGANPCFAGETLIATADGRGAVSIKQLVDEGNDVPVYSMNPNTGMVEIKMARNPRLTRELAGLVEVELDDGSIFRVTPDHKMYLLDGTKCEAQDLQSGDSLPRFQKRLEVVKKGGSDYVQVITNTRAPQVSGSRVFEHRLIARFHNPDTWADLYDESKQSGWVKGGLVVHHRDYNPINNAPDNLEIMTFKDHMSLHGSVDNRGDKNPMWGRKHTDDSKKKIGQKTKDRCKDPLFRAKLATAHTVAEREEASKRLSARRKVELLSYYREQEAKTDLETVWEGDRLYAIRSCESCGEEFVVAWRMRGQSYCNRVCMNKAGSHIKARKAGQAVAFADKQRRTLHKQVMVFKDLEQGLGRIPLKKEWEGVCREQGVSFRLRKAGTTSNPHALTGFSHLRDVVAGYNHRVRAVRHLDVREPVYNLSVDDHHTVGLVTEGAQNGIFVSNCSEQTLESYELCCLVETYPAHHESYEDFQRTLKFAYLYAKSVTLIPTHNERTNAVMNRNRRIGCSMSGIRQAIGKLGRRGFLDWCDAGYKYIQELDGTYADWLGIPRSIKTTSIKPSGCRPWHALTSTDQGVLTLEDIFEDHPVEQEWADVSKDMRAIGSGQVTKTFNNGVAPVLRITTSYGITVESTPNHQWWVKQRYDRKPSVRYSDVDEWRRADEIQPGDILDVQPGVYTVKRHAAFHALNSLALNMRGDATEIIQPTHMNPQLAWLLGYLWGDGAMSPGKYRLRWVDARRENLEKAQMILKNQFGLDASIRQSSEHRKAETLEIGSKHLWHWLIRNDVFKYYAGKIDIIPKVVRTSAQEDILAFLAGLLDADGWAGLTEQGAKLVWTSADEFFTKHVQDVALAVGLVLGWSHITGGSSFQSRRSMFHLTQSAHVDERGFEMFRRHSTKVAGMEARADFPGWHCTKGKMTSGKLILGKVVKIESVGEMPTYDIEVEGTPWFYAGAVKSHNTVSLLCGATPGVHPPHSPFYIRNIRVHAASPLLQAARDAGYKVEPDACADRTFVISFPVKTENCTEGKRDLSIWDQVALASDIQRYWADNQVSCLTGDALIRTSVGTLPMSQLPWKMGIEPMPGAHSYSGPLQVLDADNEWSSVSALVINQKQPVVKVSMEGGQSLTGTPDHEVQIIGDDLDLVWKPFGQLKSGDHLVEVINQKPYPSTNQIIQRRLGKYVYPGRSDADQVGVPTQMTTSLAEFLGYMVSDGWVQNSTGKAFGLSQEANNVADYFIELVSELFGLGVATRTDDRVGGSDVPLLSLSVWSTKVAHWLNWLGLYDDDGFKRVPWPVMSSGPRATKAFLRGVTLDGHFSTTNGRIGVMTTNSTRLADELCVLLKQVGFQPIKQTGSEGNSMQSPINGETYECKPVWVVSLSAGQSSRFMRMIGFAEDHKTDAYHQDGDKARRHVFGCVPDFGFRRQMQGLSRTCSSRMMKDHWHSLGQHEGVRVSRETLFQMRDMGVSVPDHLLRSDFTFRQVLGIESAGAEMTYDLMVDGSHSYIANGFASHNCTVTFKPEEAKEIPKVLEVFEDRLKSISFLPLGDDHGYVQAPYIEITEAEYDEMIAQIGPMDFNGAVHEQDDMFCDGESCMIPIA